MYAAWLSLLLSVSQVLIPSAWLQTRRSSKTSSSCGPRQNSVIQSWQPRSLTSGHSSNLSQPTTARIQRLVMGAALGVGLGMVLRVTCSPTPTNCLVYNQREGVRSTNTAYGQLGVVIGLVESQVQLIGRMQPVLGAVTVRRWLSRRALDGMSRLT